MYFLLYDFKKILLVIVFFSLILISIFFFAFLAILLIPFAVLILIIRGYLVNKTYKGFNIKKSKNINKKNSFIDVEYKKKEEKDL